MKRILLAAFLLISGASLALTLMASRSEARIHANTTLGPVPVGGLTRAEAAAKLAEWWALERTKQITLELPNPTRTLQVRLEQLGVVPDEAASVSQLQVSDLWDSAKEAVSSGNGAQKFPIRYRQSTPPDGPVLAFARKDDVPATPARVFYRDGHFLRKLEQVGKALDETSLPEHVGALIDADGQTLSLPLKDGQIRVGAPALNTITDVISTFTTRFPIRKKDRNTNIRIASSKIDGWVLMPGDRFSFNTVVGRRTIRDGFKTAPVFKNGKHDMGVGGGICQVSSTLYNAALFSDLEIMQRHNHSMPVPYLPVGRDATVDYGSLDLAFRNSLNTPVAISAEYEPGRLTFRILGKKDPNLSIKIESSDSKSWDAGTKTIQNPKLPAGKKKVVEKGSRGRSVRTFRLVYRDGVLVAKEPLGRSYYKGGVRVVEVGPALPVAPAVLRPPSSAAPASRPSVAQPPQGVVPR